MEKHEFRLLLGAVESCSRLYNMLSHEGRGLDRTSLATLFLRLFKDSRLLCFRRCDSDGVHGGNLFGRLHEQKRFLSPSQEEIEEHLVSDKGPDALFYALAPRGADEWEQCARPDWSRYIFDAYDSGGEVSEGKRIDTIELVGQRSRLAEAMTIIPGYRWLPGSERWQDFSPWNVTYWKTLPQGAMVTFAADADLVVRNYVTEESRRWQEFTTWYYDPPEFENPPYF